MVKVKTLTEEDYKDAAKTIGCEIATIKAVAQVESRGDGFLPDGRPVILFERHIFHKQTKGAYSTEHPDISNRKAGGYGAEGAHQWNKLNRAIELDDDAALKSASWGKFQIMGFNHEACGYSNVFDFVKAMRKSEGEQLRAFVNFIQSENLDDELRQRRWEDFAASYNGPRYRDNNYHIKLPRAYNLFKRKELTAANLAPSEPQEEDKTNNTTIDSDPVAASPLVAQSEQAPAQASIIIKDGNIEASTSEGKPPEPETVVIEKPPPREFGKEIRNNITAVTGGNLTLQGVRDYAEQAKFLGLSARFWLWVSLIALVGGAVFILAKLYKHRSDVRKDMEITQALIAGNTTPNNQIILASTDELDKFKNKDGFKIVTR